MVLRSLSPIDLLESKAAVPSTAAFCIGGAAMHRLLWNELADTQLELLLGPHIHFDDDRPRDFLRLQEYEDDFPIVPFRANVHSRHRQLGCALPNLCCVIRPKIDDRISACVTPLQTIAKNRECGL